MTEGKSVPLRETFTKDTKKDAWVEVRRRLMLYTDKDVKTPYAEFFRQWIESIPISVPTKDNYKSVYDNHLSKIGHKPLGKITVVDVRQAIGEGGAAASRKKYLAVLKSSLGWAVKQGYIVRNPAENFGLAAPIPNPEAMDPEELMKVVESCRNDWFYLPVLIAATTGVRKGEVCALRWENVKSESILVKESAYWRYGVMHVKEPKNKLYRLVPMMDVLVKGLPERGKDEELVCTREERPINGSTLGKSFKAKTGHTFHSLRHSHATWLMLLGVNPRVVQERLGHSDVAITLRTYTRVLPIMKNDSVDKLNRAWI